MRYTIEQDGEVCDSDKLRKVLFGLTYDVEQITFYGQQIAIYRLVLQQDLSKLDHNTGHVHVIEFYQRDNVVDFPERPAITVHPTQLPLTRTA